MFRPVHTHPWISDSPLVYFLDNTSMDELLTMILSLHEIIIFSFYSSLVYFLYNISMDVLLKMILPLDQIIIF